MNSKKIIAITGASSGIGFEVTEQLAYLGHTIIMIGKSEAKLMAAQKLIKDKTGNSSISIFTTDLSIQQQVRILAEQIHKQFDKLDVLINNAGAVYAKFETTEDGYEKTIATNHFNYFLLTHLLLDLLNRSEQGRIINVASDSHFSGKIDVESFIKKKNYFILRAYAQSKLANVLFTYELADRLKGTSVTVNALHPGRVRTKIGNKNQPWYFSVPWSLVMLWHSVSTNTAAKTYIYLATNDGLRYITGKYFDNCKVKPSSKLSYNKELQQLLWQTSERYCSIKY